MNRTRKRYANVSSLAPIASDERADMDGPSPAGLMNGARDA
jgi:hypothetical protein